MASARRSRTLAATPDEVWEVVADPHHLPRWWPLLERVENVGGDHWTAVMRSPKGRVVRADYRLLVSRRPTLRRFEQLLEDTPYARFLSSGLTEIALEQEPGGATGVTLELTYRLRGLARFGGFMVRRAGRRTLDEALERLERACVG